MSVNYSLYQPDIFDYFREGYVTTDGVSVSADDYFRGVIAKACGEIAETFDCIVSLSAVRLKEARILWERDVGRIEIDDSKIPNHFKQCGFLVYWLRRRIIVQLVQRKGVVRSTEQDRFFEIFE